MTATVFREGHDAVAATAVLVDPTASSTPRRMTLLAPGTDRYGATVVPDREGRWSFRVEGWSDPYGTWEHDALIKVAGRRRRRADVRGGRAAARARRRACPARSAADVAVLADAVAALRDTRRDPPARLAAGTGPAVHGVLAPRTRCATW